MMRFSTKAVSRLGYFICGGSVGLEILKGLINEGSALSDESWVSTWLTFWDISQS
jgi:hypothetical protein